MPRPFTFYIQVLFLVHSTMDWKQTTYCLMNTEFQSLATMARQLSLKNLKSMRLVSLRVFRIFWDFFWLFLLSELIPYPFFFVDKGRKHKIKVRKRMNVAKYYVMSCLRSHLNNLKTKSKNLKTWTRKVHLPVIYSFHFNRWSPILRLWHITFMVFVCSNRRNLVENDVYNFGYILLESLVGPIVTGKEETFLLNDMVFYIFFL